MTRALLPCLGALFAACTDGGSPAVDAASFPADAPVADAPVGECTPSSSEPCATPCGSTGERTCGPDGQWGDCVPPGEVCNGIDDDCDVGGTCDNGFACCVGAVLACATACGTAGTETCSGACALGACCAAAETCGNACDDDCDGIAEEGCGPAATQWVLTLGGTDFDGALAVAVAAGGGVFVTGSFGDSVDFGGGALTSAGGSDAFLAGYAAADGAHRWSRRMGAAGSDSGIGVAVDAIGDVFVVGNFVGTVDFGGGALTTASGSQDVFLAKYRGTDGVHLFSARYGGAGYDYAADVEVDAAGDVVFLGGFEMTVSFGGAALASAGGLDVFLAKYSGSDGAHLWSRRMGGTLLDDAEDVALDAAGDPVVTGSFLGSASFGGSTLTSAGSDDAFVARYVAATGAHLWSRRFGAGGMDLGKGAAVDAAGGVVVAGFFEGTVSFGGGALASAGLSDVFVLKLGGAAGAHLWSRRHGGVSDDHARAVALGPSGDPVLTGDFQSTVDFGGGPLTSAGSNDVMVARYHGSDGAPLLSRRFGGISSDVGLGVATDTAGATYVAGSFLDTVDFGLGPRTSAGARDLFVLKLAP